VLKRESMKIVHRSLAGAAFVALVGSCGSEASPAFEEPPPPPLKDRRALLGRLGVPSRFLIGHGNDLPGAEKSFDFTQAGVYTLPKVPDVHYVYLSGLVDEQGPHGPGWPDYEPDGSFVTIIAENAIERGVLPMFTLYQVAARGERNWPGLREQDFMSKYWRGVRLLFERLAELDAPAMVHLEPDFWGFAQRQSYSPEGVPVLVGELVPECGDLPGDVFGMGACILRLARGLAPKVALGFHASGFGARDRPAAVAEFLTRCGAREADFIVVETLDRDAGCFEARNDPFCGRYDGTVYWDETNQRSPSFADHLAWVRTIHERLGLPVFWWQMPLGVPSDTPGGTPKHYRDNRVRYFFAHTGEFEAAGGFGAAFGVGAPNQTDITTDGGQFARAVSAYYEAPLTLERP
jgi:hypothetical protein